MVQRLAAVAVSVWDRTQKHVECDWKRHWPTRERVQVQSERELDRSPSLPLSPKNQHRRHSRSQRLHHPVLRRCRHKTFRNEQTHSPMELGAQARRERKGARPSETPTSEISGRPVVKARPASRADGGWFGDRCPLFSCVIQQGRDDDWSLKRDRWNRRCGNSCPRGGCVAVQGNRNVHNRGSEAGRRAGINCGCGLRGSRHDGSQ